MQTLRPPIADMAGGILEPYKQLYDFLQTKREGNAMQQKFQIVKNTDRIASVNRTIRFKPELFDQVQRLSAATGVSFGKIVNQCIAYAFMHLDESQSPCGIDHEEM